MVENLTADAAAAHEFLSEIRTRIATQPLPYQHGSEARALESLRELFGLARAAMKKCPGCAKFSSEVTRMLNIEVRPVTAKWHRALVDGRLASRDGADELRGDLAEVQAKLRKFALKLQKMAYGDGAEDDVKTDVLTKADLHELDAEIAFGICKTPGVPDETIAAINVAEAAEVATRRAAYRVQTAPGINAVGLSLSGGGIRSATFCLGVVQVLAGRQLLRDVDFLSTVSGGGYTGTFLTARLRAGEGQGEVANPYGPDPAAIRYLRQHAKYLTAADLKQSWARVISALAGMILNWSAPVFVIALAAFLATALRPGVAAGWPLVFLPSALITVAALLIYGWLLRRGPTLARCGANILSTMAALTLLIGLGWLATEGYIALKGGALTWKSSALTLSGVAALVTAAPAILRFVPVLETPAIRRTVLRVLLLLAALVVPLLGLVLFYLLLALAPEYGGAATLAIIAFVLGVISVFVVDINQTGLHRLYRDLLAAAFVRETEDGDATVPLTEINRDRCAPYHLINAAVNLPSSTHPALRDRKTDFFLFSKHWCGSPVVGYERTSEWKSGGAELDLATAMAVSGAAASPHMGLGSQPTLVAFLTFLNLRLGFWIRRPPYRGYLDYPGFLCLMREMTGIAMSEKQKWINLSDGGHIENMGAYELLRRRCKYIICVDGEADPSHTFHGLMTLVRHAQIDFGVQIAPILDDLRIDAKSNRSQTHATLCRIDYPAANDGRPAAVGLLLYLKLSITGNEPELIKRYRIIHPDFPHETTLDQFFTEEQFEAYRQLGVHVADGLFSRALMTGAGAPPTIPEWFDKLARNLLEPRPHWGPAAGSCSQCSAQAVEDERDDTL